MTEYVGYHRSWTLSDDKVLVEQDAGEPPLKGAVAAELDCLADQQRSTNARLSTPEVDEIVRSAPAEQAGIYPLKVTRFSCSCEGNDDDGAAEQLVDRLGNLRIITDVPFMRKGKVIFAIRSQGLVDSTTGATESVDALFGGGIFWRGRLSAQRFDYELLMFKQGRDQFVGRMTESIDLRQRVSDIDPDIFQAEVGYHLVRESNDAAGVPTLPRRLKAYGALDHLKQVEACYVASAAFGHGVQSGSGDLGKLAQVARAACVSVPGKRYYQAYDAWLQGLGYDPTTAA